MDLNEEIQQKIKELEDKSYILSVLDRIKNILLTPEMKSSLLNTQLQTELSKGKILKMKKI